MPTGYTAKIKDGITFEEYALGCARAFGATILMRDEPSDTPIPDKFEASDYHEKKIKETRGEIFALDFLNKEKEAEIQHSEKMERHIKSLADMRETRSKYKDMLAEAERYESPSENHVEFKRFMISQIVKSIEWDCSESYMGDAPVKLSGEQWLEARIAKLDWDLNYHEKGHAEELDRVNERNLWIKQLRESLNHDQ